jgi:hypothetical protein
MGHKLWDLDCTRTHKGSQCCSHDDPRCAAGVCDVHDNTLRHVARHKEAGSDFQFNCCKLRHMLHLDDSVIQASIEAIEATSGSQITPTPRGIAVPRK